MAGRTLVDSELRDRRRDVDVTHLSPVKKTRLLIWEYGHIHASSDPDMTLGAFLRAGDKDRRVVEAVKSYQEFLEPDFHRAVERHYGPNRAANADGDIGPATCELLTTEFPRCGHPDIPHPSRAVEEANWPTSCRSTLKYGRTFAELPGLTRQQTDMIWWGICNNWWAVSDDSWMVPELDITVSPSKLDAYATLRALLGSTLAWQTLAVNRCDVSLEGAYDSTQDWSRMDFTVTTGSHEIGHFWGHNHVSLSTALMYPSINSSAITRRGRPADRDLDQHLSLGYKVRSQFIDLSGDKLWAPRGETPQEGFTLQYIDATGKPQTIVCSEAMPPNGLHAHGTIDGKAANAHILREI